MPRRSGVCGGHSSSGVLSDTTGVSNVPGPLRGRRRGRRPAPLLPGRRPWPWAGSSARKRPTMPPASAEPEQRSGLKAWLRKEAAEFEAPLGREGGLPTSLVEFKARARVQYYLKPPKNPVFLQKAAWWMERIRQEDLPPHPSGEPARPVQGAGDQEHPHRGRDDGPLQPVPRGKAAGATSTGGRTCRPRSRNGKAPGW